MNWACVEVSTGEGALELSWQIKPLFGKLTVGPRSERWKEVNHTHERKSRQGLVPERVSVGFPGARNEARVGGEDRRGGSGSQRPVKGPHSDSLLQHAYCIC